MLTSKIQREMEGKSIVFLKEGGKQVFKRKVREEEWLQRATGEQSQRHVGSRLKWHGRGRKKTHQNASQPRHQTSRNERETQGERRERQKGGMT